MKVTYKAAAIAMSLFALAGCASQSDNAAAPSSSLTSSASPSPSITALISPVVVPDCMSRQLSIFNGRHGVAMGNVSDDGVRFRNNSTSPCTLKGYPKLQMIDLAGVPITTHLHQGNSYTVQFTPEELITLLPGGEAMFDLGYTDSAWYGSGSCPTSSKVEITPPRADRTIIVDWKLQPFGGSYPKLRCGEITVSPVYAPPGR